MTHTLPTSYENILPWAQRTVPAGTPGMYAECWALACIGCMPHMRRSSAHFKQVMHWTLRLPTMQPRSGSSGLKPAKLEEILWAI